MSKLVQLLHDHISTSDVALKATGGFIASVMLSVPSWLENFEAWLRVISLFGSILVAILTCTMLIKKLTKSK